MTFPHPKKVCADSSSRAERLIIEKPTIAVLSKLRQAFSFLDERQLF
jgi:hypothetical protein